MFVYICVTCIRRSYRRRETLKCCALSLDTCYLLLPFWSITYNIYIYRASICLSLTTWLLFRCFILCYMFSAVFECGRQCWNPRNFSNGSQFPIKIRGMHYSISEKKRWSLEPRHSRCVMFTLINRRPWPLPRHVPNSALKNATGIRTTVSWPWSW